MLTHLPDPFFDYITLNLPCFTEKIPVFVLMVLV